MGRRGDSGSRERGPRSPKVPAGRGGADLLEVSLSKDVGHPGQPEAGGEVDGSWLQDPPEKRPEVLDTVWSAAAWEPAPCSVPWSHLVRGDGITPQGAVALHRGLFSNIWLWRGIAGVLTAAVILILCIQFVNCSSAKDFPVCPSLELCPSGWLYFQRKCYYLSDSEASWNSSQSLCSLHNASLLVIENHQELSFMVKITKQDPWIGLYKRNEEFFWVNGKELDTKLIEVKGSGSCAYLDSKGVSASGCYLTRKWVCSLNISLA